MSVESRDVNQSSQNTEDNPQDATLPSSSDGQLDTTQGSDSTQEGENFQTEDEQKNGKHTPAKKKRTASKRKAVNTLSSAYVYRSPCSTPQGRDTKPGWYEMHAKNKMLARSSHSELVLMGDSIIAGLSRYQQVWRDHFSDLRALNFGIGGDRTQHVLWRAENLQLAENIKYVVIHCGTNNIDRDDPRNIADGVLSVGLVFQDQKPEINIIVTGLLPRDKDDTSFRRKKIAKVNKLLKRKCLLELRNFTYMRQVGEWTHEDGELNMDFFFTDYLHLIEGGNNQFATTIVKTLNKLKNGEEIEYSSDEEGDEEEEDLEAELCIERRHGKRRRSRSPVSASMYSSYKRKRTSYSPVRKSRRRSRSRSPPRRSSKHRWSAGDTLSGSPYKWSAARKMSKSSKMRSHDDSDDEREKEKTSLESVAKSIDISKLDERRRREARIAKFGGGGVLSASSTSLEEISVLSKKQIKSNSSLVKKIKQAVSGKKKENEESTDEEEANGGSISIKLEDY